MGMTFKYTDTIDEHRFFNRRVRKENAKDAENFSTLVPHAA